MREIKFRAWDKELKMMDYDFYLHSSGKQYQFAERNYDTPHIEIEPCDLKVMQYTGLKDKNGREIYEGDIVNHLYHYYAGHGVVSEENEIIVIEDIAKLPFDGSSVECEIIGNIYENPELLEGK